MLIYFKNQPLKDIPEKYMVIENITDYLEDEHTTRLTDEERLSLSWALFTQESNAFLQWDDKENFRDLITGSKPAYCSKVEVRGGKTYYALHLKNGIAIKCEKWLYQLAPVKVRRHHVATLEADTSKHEGQLQLF